MSSLIEKPVIFQNQLKQNLWGVVTSPREKKKHPAVLLVHGFSGTKSQRKFVELSRKLANQGYLTMRFDFSGCGDSEGDYQRFSINQQVKELKAAVDFLRKKTNVDNQRIAILGYSIGALITAFYQIQEKTAKCLIFLAPALNQKDLFQDWFKLADIKKWQQQGYLDSKNGRIGLQYYREAKDYTSLASGIFVPTMIVHGLEDKDVLPKYSHQLFRSLAKPKKIILVKGAEHGFENYQAKKALYQLTVNWLKKYL